MNVPLLDLHAQNDPLKADLLAAVGRVFDTQRFIMGPEVEGLERDLCERFGFKHAIGVSSGTDALILAMMGLGIGAGDEVVMPTYSFFATAGCAVRLGARPVLVDIDDETFNMDPAATAAAVTGRTRALMPVHLFGLCADMDALMSVARTSKLSVIEDACQSIGSRYRGRVAGTMGDANAFSFFPSKNLGAFGDAGLVSANSDALDALMRRLRNHGQGGTYIHSEVGGNFRLDALQAAVLRIKAPHLSAWTAARQRNAQRYFALFAERRLTDLVRLPTIPEDYDHIFNQFVIRVERRDELKAHLDKAGVGNAIYYPVPFHLQECFAFLGHKPGEFPVAERAAKTSLAIPIYGELTEAQQARVVSAVGEFYGR